MNYLFILALTCVATYTSASDIGTYVDGYGGAVVKGHSGTITSQQIPGKIAYGDASYGTYGTYGTSYGTSYGHGAGVYGGVGHAVAGPATHAVLTGPRTHATVTGPSTSAVVTGPRSHAVVTGPVATAEIRGPQSHAVLSGPVANTVVVPAVASYGGYGQGYGHGYGLGHAGVVGHGLISGYGYGDVTGYGNGLLGHTVYTNGGGVVKAGHDGAIVKGPPTVPALISGPSGKVYAEGLWGPTTQGLYGYAHG